MLGYKPTVVGRFFEGLAHSIIGGELIRNEEGDIYLKELNTIVEVKSAADGSSYGFRLDVSQLDYYTVAGAGFPFDRALYVFITYRNRAKKIPNSFKRRMQMAEYEKPHEINRYLADAVSSVLILDNSIVGRWRETRRIVKGSVLGHPDAKTINLKAREIYRLSNGGLKDEIEHLRLSPDSYAVLRGIAKTRYKSDLYNVYWIRVPVTIVVPEASVRPMQRMFAQRKFPLKRGKI